MSKLLLGLSAVVLLSGCNSPGSDSYNFQKEEYERLQPEITVVVHPSFTDLRSSAPVSVRDNEERELMGWSVIRGNTCELHTVDPKKEWRPEWLGHELAHCIWGRWHD